jgi:polyferredoxin
MKLTRYRLPAAVFLFTAIILSLVQVKLQHNPILLAERFFRGSGWIEIFVISLYGGFVAYKMQEPANVPAWRRITWSIFSIVFFLQLFIGLSGAEKFLMTGKLHLPVPAMIIAGPIYRGHLSVMTILFLSTVVLTGPAWCSQLCYFGAFDNLASRGRTSRKTLKNKAAIKSTFLLLVIAVTLVLRWIGVSSLFSTLTAVIFGTAGILIMIVYSRKQGKMIHCTMYCPIGTTVSLFKYVNPFRMYIDTNCTLCMKCSVQCKYDALSIKNIRDKKPGMTCTYCGDCLSACHENSIKYKFFKLSPSTSRYLYLFLTISLHASFLAMARI